MKLFVNLFGKLTVAVLLVSCGTIIHGTSQDVGISSSPTGAKVTIDNKEYGKTPTTATLKRKDHHVVKIELEGYQVYETNLTRKVSGWIAGNILFGGIIGLAVDAISGGMYKLTPDQIESTLNKEEMSINGKRDHLFIMFVLQPDPGWKKVGQLKKAK